MKAHGHRRFISSTLFGLLLAVLSTTSVSAATTWTTYHLDLSRSGNDTNDLPLTSVAHEWTTAVDQNVYAEPLVLGNTVYIATENDTVSALDAGTGAVLWSQSVGTAVPNTNPPFFCGNVGPIGVTGTPVIDPSGLMYVVGLTWDGTTAPSIHYQLSVLNLNSSGAIAWQRSIAPTDPNPTNYVFDPLIEGQRGALALANNMVYIPFGGRYGDCNDTTTGTRYRGWMVGAPTSGASAPLSSYPLHTTNGGGGFWAAAGPAVDGATPANIYITSGNTFCSGGCSYDYGETILKLSSTLALQASFVPPDWSALNAGDTDLGSVGPALLNNGLLFQVGKSGDAYLIRASDMTQAYPAVGSFAHACPGLTQDAAFGGTAYAPPYVYIPCSDGVVALNVATAPTPSFSVAWHGPTEASPGGPPIVAGGVVWSIDNRGTLYGLDPTTGAVLFNGSLGSGADHFATPAAADGRVFVAAGTQVEAFGNLGGPYHPLVPARILDTRYGTGGHTGPLGANQTMNVQVTGRGGVPPSGVLAAVLNVTVTGPTAPSHLIVYPTGVSRPNTSNVNFGAGQTVPNLVEVGLGAGGEVSVYNYSGSTDVVMDVEGYVAAPSPFPAPDGLYKPLVPARVLDTRDGTGGYSSPVGPGQTIVLQVTGRGNVPASGVEAVVMNLTVTGPSNASFLTVWPDGSPRPNASNVNFVPGQTVANRAAVKLGSNGKVDIFNFGGTVHAIADVNGWFTDSTPGGTGSSFSPLLPDRLYDTRFGTGGIHTPLGQQASISVQVAGLGSVPAMTAPVPPKAVVVNVTVTNTTGASFLTLWPDGSAQPVPASDLNWVRGPTVPTLVVVGLGANGKIDLFNWAGSTDWLIDVVGWYG